MQFSQSILIFSSRINAMILTVLLPYAAADSWKLEKQVYADKIVSIAAQYTPNLKQHIFLWMRVHL